MVGQAYYKTLPVIFHPQYCWTKLKKHHISNVSDCQFIAKQLSQDLPASSGELLQSAFQGWELIFD